MRRKGDRASIRTVNEIIFVVEDAPEGGLTARAVGESIFTQAATMAELHGRVRDAVRCHFDEGTQPKLIHPRRRRHTSGA